MGDPTGIAIVEPSGIAGTRYDDDQIVVSVGPYTFNRLRHCREMGAKLGRNASPPT